MQQQIHNDSNSPTETQYPRSSAAWYAVGILVLAYTSSMIDRVIISYLVGPIKATFRINDSQMSLLMGIAFTLFYSVLGVPAGRLADRLNRRSFAAVGITLWSLATAYCGLAASYVQLFIGRVAVGFGEATLSPAAYSLIADYFPPKKRTTAMSVYSMGISIGNGTAVMLAGSIAGFAAGAGMMNLPVLGDIHAWQLIFFMVGLPGLAVAALMLTVREPKRLGVDSHNSATTLSDFFQHVKRHKMAVFCHVVGFGMFSIFNQGVGFWFPEFFVRTFAWKKADIGVWQGSTSIIMGTLGLWVGSRLAKYFFERGKSDANMRVMLIAAAGLLPFAVIMPFMPSGNLAAPFFIATGFFGFMPYGAAPAAIQQLFPNQMRGQAGALYLLTINILGGSLGPNIVAALTDYVYGNPLLLKYSIATVALGSLSLAVCLYSFGLKHFRASVEAT